jgi:ketosteroid isomerase-like protein
MEKSEVWGGRDFIRGSATENISYGFKRVLQASDLALVITEWSFRGTGPDGDPVNMTAKSADVLRHQADGTWRFVIDNPWGTD